MAFKVASGYTNLPNGNFSPVIYSQKVQQAFRKSSVAESITNNDYFGEIANFGDTVRIIKEPEITVKAYSRGTTVTPQDLDDEDFTLTVDQANYFAFKMDDIEEALGYLSGFKQSALNTVADTANDTVSGTKAVSTAGSNELLSSMTLKKGDFGNITTTSAGDHSIPLAVRMPGATAAATATATPLQVIARMARLLNVQQVDTAGRFLVVDPVFMELLSDEDSRLLNNDTADKGGLVNGISIGNLHGFDVYVSSNLPSVGTGSATSGSGNQNTNFGVLVAGHSSAVATASQINKVESYRDPESFADIVRGMQMYGRKILRPEGIVTAKYNAA